MKIRYSSKFASQYKKLPRQVKLQAEKQERQFRKDPFDTQLKTHKLSGRLRGLWSFSIDKRHRIIFEFAGKNTIWFHTVGTHDIYR